MLQPLMITSLLIKDYYDIMKIDKELVKNIAMHFAPTYHSSSDEYQYLVELEQDSQPKISLCHPPWKPFIYYSISNRHQMTKISMRSTIYLFGIESRQNLLSQLNDINEHSFGLRYKFGKEGNLLMTKGFVFDMH